MIFDHINSDDVLNYYNNHDNYKIIENENCRDCNCTVVYFSSNGIYYPNTYEEFKLTIKNKNRYEWLKVENQFQYANKIIYVRDIHKQWYLKGINKEINSFEKLAKFIKKQHTSKKLILIGASSGGYVATIIGSILNADAVFSFSGQFTLEPILKEAKNKLVNELYDKHKSYYNLESLLKKNDVDIFYFVCKYSKIDKADMEIASNYSRIHKFYFECDNHGIPFHSTILKRMLSTSKEDLISLSNGYNRQPMQPSFFWKSFFNRGEYIVALSIYRLKNLKKIPSYILQRIKGSI